MLPRGIRAGGRGRHVTPNSPMRRGLKSQIVRAGGRGDFESHTEFPDEEGTEMCGYQPSRQIPRPVTPNSPMRRGLKYRRLSDGSDTKLVVTPNSPMRRGLKYLIFRHLSMFCLGTSHRIPR